MADTTQTTSGRAPGNETTYGAIAAGNFPIGTPVRPSLSVDGVVVPARAVEGGANVTGIAVTPGIDGQPVLVQFAGPLALTAEQWGEIKSGGGGLVRGTPYFLFAGFVGGLITATAPSSGGTFVAPIGVALSEAEMLIRIDPPTEN